MSQVVVTGAGGFLGRAVMKALEAHGIEVQGVARTPLAGCQRVADYRQAPVGRVLVHLAEDPDRGRVNGVGESYLQQCTALLTELLAKGYQQVIYASSSVVYGDRNTLPNRPADPTVSSDVYCRNKLACEALVLASGGAVLRLANLIGPGMSAANVVSEVLQQLATPGPVSIRNGAPVRDFLWIDDAAEAVARLIEKPDAGVYNLGSGQGVSILDLIRMVFDAAGQPEREIVQSVREGAGSVNVLDISETTARLGWRPATSIRGGLAILVKSMTNTVGQQNG